MKTADIVEGELYYVRLSEEQSLIYRGCEVKARVVRAGFHYEVEVVRGSRVRGAPFKSTHESEHPTGVEVVWEAQQVESRRRHADWETVPAGRAVVNARAVREPVRS